MDITRTSLCWNVDHHCVDKFIRQVKPWAKAYEWEEPIVSVWQERTSHYCGAGTAFSAGLCVCPWHWAREARRSSWTWPAPAGDGFIQTRFRAETVTLVTLRGGLAIGLLNAKADTEPRITLDTLSTDRTLYFFSKSFLWKTKPHKILFEKRPNVPGKRWWWSPRRTGGAAMVGNPPTSFSQYPPDGRTQPCQPLSLSQASCRTGVPSPTSGILAQSTPQDTEADLSFSANLQIWPLTFVQLYLQQFWTAGGPAGRYYERYLSCFENLAKFGNYE